MYVWISYDPSFYKFCGSLIFYLYFLTKPNSLCASCLSLHCFWCYHFNSHTMWLNLVYNSLSFDINTNKADKMRNGSSGLSQCSSRDQPGLVIFSILRGGAAWLCVHLGTHTSAQRGYTVGGRWKICPVSLHILTYDVSQSCTATSYLVLITRLSL